MLKPLQLPLRDSVTMFFQTFEIALNSITNIRHCSVARFPLGNTAGQSRAFGNKNAVFIRFNRDTKFHTASVAIGGAAGNATADIVDFHRFTPLKHPRPESLHIWVRAFAMFSDEAVDPRRDNGQRYGAELEHSIVESADVEFETRSFPNLLAATLATLR